MNFIVIEGHLGSGKTLGASIIATHYAQKSGCTLYSNYGLKNSIFLDNIEQFKDVAVQKHSIIVLDEGHIDLDARSFNSNHVKFLTQTSYYLRKLRCTIILPTPSFADLDSRIRRLTNILIRVRKKKTYFYYDMYDIQSLRFLKTMKIAKDKAIALDIFDTGKIVKPLKIPNNKADYIDFLDELEQINDNYYKGRKEKQTA